jgi:hypothetical protein
MTSQQELKDSTNHKLKDIVQNTSFKTVLLGINRVEDEGTVEELQAIVIHTNKAIQRKTPTPKVVPPLKYISTVSVAGAETFIAKDFFKKRNPDGIKFYLWSNFKECFLPKTEKNIPDTQLAINKLTKSSVDKLIREAIQRLGQKEETTLTYLYNLLKEQKNGEE